MGAWGLGTFQDDTALDWLEVDFAEFGAKAVVDALAAVNSIPVSEYLESGSGVYGRAAAEAVTVSFGNGPSELDDDKRALIGEHAEAIIAISGIKDAALLAINRITSGNSELNELWTEDDETGSEWLANMTDLQERLRK